MVAIMDSSLNEILRPLLQQEKILDELGKDTSANKDQIETQQLKIQEQGCCQSKIMALLQEVERNQRAINMHQEDIDNMMGSKRLLYPSGVLKKEVHQIERKVVKQSQTIHRQDNKLKRIDGTVEQNGRAIIENSDEIFRIKQKQDDATGIHVFGLRIMAHASKCFISTSQPNNLLVFSNSVTVEKSGRVAQ